MMNNFGNTTAAQPITDAGQPQAITNDEVISQLNGLIETCRDGQEGFKQSAEGIDRDDLKTLFYEFSQERASFVGELQDIVRGLGGDPENSGSITGAMHRGWINIKSAVTGKDVAAILNEAERGEDIAVGQYRSALEQPLPEVIRQTVQNQYTKVQAAHDRVKALRDVANAKKAAS